MRVLIVKTTNTKTGNLPSVSKSIGTLIFTKYYYRPCVSKKEAGI